MMIGKNASGRGASTTNLSAIVTTSRQSMTHGGRWSCMLLAAAFLSASLSAAAIAGDRVAGQGVGVQVADGEVPPFRLVISGDTHTRFRAECRALKSANAESQHDSQFTFVDQGPSQFNMAGPAVECMVRKLKGAGVVSVALRRGDGSQIATSAIYTRRTRLVLRSSGPWGLAGARAYTVP